MENVNDSIDLITRTANESALCICKILYHEQELQYYPYRSQQENTGIYALFDLTTKVCHIDNENDRFKFK